MGDDERYRDQRSPYIHFRRHTGELEADFEDSPWLFRLILAWVKRHMPEYLEFLPLANDFPKAIFWEVNSRLYQEIYGPNN